jgi:hypothetical protein
MKAHDKFGLEMEFKSLLSDGILLYGQQRKDPAVDFISLAIVAGYVISHRSPTAIIDQSMGFSLRILGTWNCVSTWATAPLSCAPSSRFD